MADLQDAPLLGRELWFEYHCWEDPKSADAAAWYRSHTQVEVLSGPFRDDRESPVEDDPDLASFAQRSELGECYLYKVRWPDGFEYHVFEDELMESPMEFCRPDPPSPGKGIAEREA